MRHAILLLAATGLTAAEFRVHEIATDLKNGYQVVIADLNKDSRPDIIALASGMDELVWFENPAPPNKEWKRHVMARGMKRMINCAAHDTDGDGIPEIVVASMFDNQPKNSIGGVAVLKANGDPRDEWAMSEIDRLTTSHRIRWADIDGSGRKVAINAPLAGAGAEAPDFRAHVPLVYYRPGPWKRETIDSATEGVMHGIHIMRDRKDDRDSILTASFLGIHRYRFNGFQWRRNLLFAGDPAAWPKSGSSDVARGKDFYAAIEPWHGSQVVVYSPQRTVIDATLDQGHTIQVADFDGDGKEEILAGYRGKGGGVLLYRQSKKVWERSVIDDKIAANSCEVGDLNGDRKPDFVCIGGATANLKWYENVTPKR